MLVLVVLVEYTLHQNTQDLRPKDSSLEGQILITK